MRSSRRCGRRFPATRSWARSPGHIEGARDGGGYRWIVDPLDGTVNFVHGFPYYAVSVALAHGTEITHAVVLDPVHDELFTAIQGKGAFCNGAPMHVSTCLNLSDALVGTVFPTRESPRLPDYLPTFNALITQCVGVRRAGSCALDLAHLAAGRLDGFWVMSLKAWDIAAGALLVKEAGGRVGDFAGGTQFLRTNEVIAAAPGSLQSAARSDRRRPRSAVVARCAPRPLDAPGKRRQRHDVERRRKSQRSARAGPAAADRSGAGYPGSRHDVPRRWQAR